MVVNRRAILVGGGSITLVGVGAIALGRQMGTMENYNATVAATRASLPKAVFDMMDVVRYATLAASGHNTQPWRFHQY